VKNKGILWCPHCGQPHRLGERFCGTTGKPLDVRVNRAVVRPPARTASAQQQQRVIDGKYRVIRRIGRGGMGDVFEAENLILKRRVAIKVVASSRGGDAAVRLAHEARTIAALRHPNICDVYDTGTTADGKPYLVLEYLDGEGLDARLRRGRMSPSAVIELFSQMLSALQTAHSSGIVHRDLKPANVFLVERAGCAPLVKVLDFGFAKDLSGTLFRTITRPGIACGTPNYMAPEQLRALPIDARADLFSVGVMLFEALSGRHPFPGTTPLEVGASILREAPRRLSAYRPELADLFDEIIARALEKDPNFRYASALAMQRALLGAPAEDDDGPESYSDTRPLALLAASSAPSSG
jgi:serine/threonine-protein kinase